MIRLDGLVERLYVCDNAVSVGGNSSLVAVDDPLAASAFEESWLRDADWPFDEFSNCLTGDRT